MTKKQTLDGSAMAKAFTAMQWMVDSDGKLLLEWYEERGMKDFVKWEDRRHRRILAIRKIEAACK